MRHNKFLLISLIILIVISFNYYLENKEAKSEILRKELIIFQNHVTSTVRAINKQDKNLLDDTNLRITTFETFNSPYIDSESFATLTVDVYKEALRNLLNTEPNEYIHLEDNLQDIFNTLTSYAGDELTEDEFNKIVDELLPKVEEFRDEINTLNKD